MALPAPVPAPLYKYKGVSWTGESFMKSNALNFLGVGVAGLHGAIQAARCETNTRELLGGFVGYAVRPLRRVAAPRLFLCAMHATNGLLLREAVGDPPLSPGTLASCWMGCMSELMRLISTLLCWSWPQSAAVA